jgi:hypothetical protein
MDIPTAVEGILDEETVVERVGLDGEDALFVTPSRTIHYSAESFLSDESVEAYPHDAERIGLREKRRKAAIELDYGTDGERSLTVPSDHVDTALEPLLAGVFAARGVIEPGESVNATYRFGELTLVVTERRIVKHVGAPVWDEEYVDVAFEDLQGLSTEQGNVASQLVLSTPARTERIKTPNEGFRAVDETVREALYDFYDVDSQAGFEAAVAPEEDDEAEQDTQDEPAEETVEFVQASGPDVDALESKLDALAGALDEQEAAIQSQQAAIEEQRSHLEALREELEDHD